MKPRRPYAALLAAAAFALGAWIAFAGSGSVEKLHDDGGYTALDGTDGTTRATRGEVRLINFCLDRLLAGG